jgi:hypothetical protein
MWELAVTIAQWVWKEREFLTPLLAKYINSGKAEFVFDGDKVKSAIIKYEPLVWDVVKNGVPVALAIAKLIVQSFTPHKMTPAEEKIWMDRMASPDTPTF